jgi:transcription elongation factor Elf1
MIPDWFDTEEIDRKPVQCPHCGSSYIYMKAGEEATVNCQHCGKPFSMSKAT